MGDFSFLSGKRWGARLSRGVTQSVERWVLRACLERHAVPLRISLGQVDAAAYPRPGPEAWYEGSRVETEVISFRYPEYSMET